MPNGPERMAFLAYEEAIEAALEHLRTSEVLCLRISALARWIERQARPWAASPAACGKAESHPSAPADVARARAGEAPGKRKGAHHESTRLPRPGPPRLGDRARSVHRGADRRRRPDRLLHDLRHRPAHPQGGRP